MAYVYIWPMLSMAQLEDIEADLVYAGYTEKKQTIISDVPMWRCS